MYWFPGYVDSKESASCVRSYWEALEVPPGGVRSQIPLMELMKFKLTKSWSSALAHTPLKLSLSVPLFCLMLLFDSLLTNEMNQIWLINSLKTLINLDQTSRLSLSCFQTWPLQLFQVLVDGNVNTYVTKGLSAASEYEVLLVAIYGNQAESEEVVLFESTGTPSSFTSCSSEETPQHPLNSWIVSSDWWVQDFSIFCS